MMENIDIEESTNKKKSTINKNAEIAKIYDNWNVWKNGKNQALDINMHYTPSQSAKKILKFLENKDRNIKILDAGCGNGNIAQVVLKAGFQVEGCDISSSAKNKIKKFYNCSIDSLPMKDSFYDVVYSFSVLHHLDNPKKGISEFKRVLKKNGFLIITNHTKYSVFTLFRKYFLSYFKKHSHLKYLRFDSVSTWINRLKEEKFEIIDYEGIQGSFILNFFADCLSKILPEKYNLFAYLDKFIMNLFPKKWSANMAYHSLIVVKKNEE